MPGVARLGDKGTTGHSCSRVAPISTRQYTVFANGKALSHKTAPIGKHLWKVCYPPPTGCVCENHRSTVKQGSLNVFVTGLEVASLGAKMDIKGKIFQSSYDVFVNGLGSPDRGRRRYRRRRSSGGGSGGGDAGFGDDPQGEFGGTGSASGQHHANEFSGAGSNSPQHHANEFSS